MFEELFEKGTECTKEIALYTPTGAALLHEVSFMSAEVTHFVLIFSVPIVVLLVKGRLHHHKALKEGIYDIEHKGKHREGMAAN